MAALRVVRTAAALATEPNEAARAWGAQNGLDDAAWHEVALSLATVAAARRADPANAGTDTGAVIDIDLPAGASSRVLRCRWLDLPDGALVWVAPLDDHDEANRLLADQLDLAQEFGRMGMFVRDLDSGAGQWDRHSHRILGLDAAQGTPDFADVLRRSVHPDDAAALQAHHRQIQRAGERGSVRYRIRRPDGEVRHIQSIFEVRAVPGSAGLRLVGVLIDDTEVHQRTAAEQRAKQVLERALELAGVSVWRIDLATQRIHFNAVGFRVVGMEQLADGVALEAMRETIHPDDRAAVVQAADEACAGDQVVDLVARYRNTDGSWRTLLTRRVAERDEQGAVISLAGISLNIGAQVAERERADALAARTRLVAEAIGVGFWSRDGDTGAAHWDEQLYRIHGRPPALGPPALGEWIPHHVHADDQVWMQALQNRTQAEWAPMTDATFRLPDTGGGERWLQSWTRRVVRNGRRLAFGMHLDVTDRQREQASLERERDRQQFAINAAEIGVWERGLDGRIAYWNSAMYRLRGLDPADPRPPAELLALTTHPEDHAAMLEAAEHQRSGGEPFRLEYRVRGADGTWRWLATQGRAVHDAQGQLRGMVGVNLDVTERRRAEALLHDKQRAEQASRDKSAFMARMSHELRTPMNAVLGFAQLLDDDSTEPPTERQRARLQRIREAGAQLMALIDDVLELASLDTEPEALASAPAPTPERTAVDEVVRDVVASVAALAGRHGQRLQVGELPVAAFVRAEGHRLSRALAQLMAHAIRLRGEPGRLEIAASLHSEADGQEIVFSVRDHGSGLPTAATASLFGPLAEPHQEAGSDNDDRGGSDGSNLALSLSERVVESLGGRLDHSLQADGSGSVFTVRLPAAAAADGNSSASAVSAATPAPAAALTVLCVEDNPVNMLLVQELLSLRSGLQVVAAVDGRSGIALGRECQPQIALLDLQLPDIDGVEVLRQLRAEPTLAHCAFVALSANAMPADIDAALAAGFDEYWTKPIDFGRFLVGIDRLIARFAGSGDAAPADRPSAGDPRPGAAPSQR